MQRWRKIWPYLVTLCAISIYYLPTWTFPFAWDDKNLIRDAVWLRDPGLLPKIFTSDYWELAAAAHQSAMYRPVVIASFWLEVQVAAGPASALAHATNHALLLLNTSLLMLLARFKRASIGASAVAGALFAFHPAVTESVANICSRTDALSSFGLLVAGVIACAPTWTGETQNPALKLIRWSLVALAIFFALLAKEQALAAPLLLALLVAYGGDRWKLEKDSLRNVALACGSALFFYFVLRLISLGQVLPASSSEADTALVEVLGQDVPTLLLPFTRLAAYLGLTLWPTNLTPVMLAQPARWTWIAWPILLALGFYLQRKHASSALAFALLWFVVALAPVSEWIAVGARYSGLLLYTPLLGLALALATAIKRKRTIAAMLTLCFLSCFAGLPWYRAWRSEESLWQRAVEYGPPSGASHLNYANALSAAMQVELALDQYQRAIELEVGRENGSTAVRAHFSRGNLLHRLGRLNEAQAELQLAFHNSHEQLYQAAVNLAAVCMAKGDREGAKTAAQDALRHGSHHPQVLLLVAQLAQERGDMAQARDYYKRTLVIDPSNQQAKQQLGQLPRP